MGDVIFIAKQEAFQDTQICLINSLGKLNDIFINCTIEIGCYS